MHCTHYDDRVRCSAEATHRMIAPNGTHVPNGFFCRPHAEAPINEYAEKLGERWTAAPIKPVGTELYIVPDVINVR